MRILFDNSAFSKLAQQPDRAIHLQRVKDLVERGKLTVTGCCTILQELAGLADLLCNDSVKTQIYLRTLSEYEQVIQGAMLRPASELLKMELEQTKALVYQNSLLTKEEAKNLISNLKNLEIADLLFSETKTFKGLNGGYPYATVMEKAYQDVLFQLDPHSKITKGSITTGYRNWFERFNTTIEEWYKTIELTFFNAKPRISVKELPHVSAFLGYVLTRIYERFTFNIKDRDNDLFDRAYFIDAAVVDVLVTDDRAFRRTARRIPNRNIDVMNLNEFASLIDEQLRQ